MISGTSAGIAPVTAACPIFLVRKSSVHAATRTIIPLENALSGLPQSPELQRI
jgi:hypothetical protein